MNVDIIVADIMHGDTEDARSKHQDAEDVCAVDRNTDD